jgi:inorganic pyrophosphatase
MINVIVEIPRGSQNKYEYDHEAHTIKLDRHLLVSMGYPAEYGFIPDTLGGDGDPLDALVLTEYPTFPGCLIEAKILGMCIMTDENGEDAKILFTVYKDLDEGKWMKVENWVGRDDALKELEASRSRYLG